MSVADKTKRRVRLATVLSAASLGAYLFAAACGSSRPAATDGAQATPGSVLTGPCTVEGTSNSCHIETGRSGDLVNCFSGTQVCHDGVWSACGGAAGGSGTLSTMNVSRFSAGAGNLVQSTGTHALSISSGAPSAEAGGCAANPCNPNCVGIDTDAGNLAPDGGIISVAVQGSDQQYTDFPTAKQNANVNPCNRAVPAVPDFKECSYDYCCESPDGGGATGQCVQWQKVPEAGLCNSCTGPDFTAAVGCKTAGDIHIPVCNRGTTPFTGNLFVGEWTANPDQSGTAAICSAPGSGYGGGCVLSYSAANPLDPGKCTDVSPTAPAANVLCSSTGLWGAGNRVVMVNPPSIPAPLPAALAAAYGGAYAQVATECDKCNNQSFVYTSSGTCAAYGIQPPPPAAYSFVQSALCLPGYKVQWNQFAWQGTVPNASQMDLTISTAPLLADGGVGAFGAPIPIATAQNPGGPDYATCRIDTSYVSVTGTTGMDATKCPKNLTTLLGAQSLNPNVSVGITLTSTTAIATLQGWQITYNCIAAE